MKLKVFVTVSLLVLLSSSLLAHGGSMTEVIAGYMKVKNALVGGDSKAAALGAADFVSALDNVLHTPVSETEAGWSARKKALIERARTIESALKIEKQRAALAELSVMFWPLVKSTKNSTTVYYQYCPMKKSYWLSTLSDIENPYYGQSMLTCGRTTESTK